MIPEQEEALNGVGNRTARPSRRDERDVAPRGRENALQRVDQGRTDLGHLLDLHDAENGKSAFLEPLGREIGSLLDQLRLGGAPYKDQGTERGKNPIEAAASGRA